MTSLQFTPVHAPCGGALLGIASIAKLALTGRVLGVSESFKRPLTGDVRGSDAAFVAGLLFAGAMHTAISGGVAAMPHEPMVPLAQAALAGFLVGVGSSLGNGCTSGHGICGNARLSPRSMAYTCVFMLFGFGAATLAGTNAALGIAEASALRNVAYPAAASVAHWAALAAAAVAAFAARALLASGSRGRPPRGREVAGRPGKPETLDSIQSWFPRAILSARRRTRTNVQRTFNVSRPRARRSWTWCPISSSAPSSAPGSSCRG